MVHCICTVLATVVPAAYAGTPAEGLILWLDASDTSTMTLDGDRVRAWRNKAPGAGNALEADSARAPQYDPGSGRRLRPVVRFDGRDDVLRDLAFDRKAPRWTLVVVAAPDSGGGGLCTARSHDGHDYDPGFTVDLYASGERFDQISVEGAGRIGGQRDQLIRDFAYGELHVIVVERDDTEIRLFVDGVAEEARPVSPAVTMMDELRVGARCYADAERAFFEGAITEVLLYARVLEPDERKDIQQTRAVSRKEQKEGRERMERIRAERMAGRMVAPKVVRTWPSVVAYEEWKRSEAGADAFVPVRDLPIRDNLHEAIALCVGHLNSLYDADRDNEPFFYANLRADGAGEMHHSVNIGIPHVVGRCLLGCMAAELVAGVSFPEDGLGILERYLKGSFDNPDHLNSYYDPEQDNRRFIEFHNMREGLYGLWALVAGRNSAWAREEVSLMLSTLDRITDENGQWSLELARKMGMGDRCHGVSVPNAARMVDALLAIYRCTEDPLALKLAGAYAHAGLDVMFEGDGAFAPMARSSGHVHSVTSALSGITDYALLTGDVDMVAACRRIMDVGVPEYHSSWGWGDEVFPTHPADVPSRGEINQTGDVVRTALLLGAGGYPQYHETAERYLRSMLLPTQHREEQLRCFMKENENPSRDAERDVLKRTVGGFAMQLPNDRMREGDWPLSTLDITSGAVHALVECWRHRVTERESTCFVNLLFDCDHPDVSVQSGLPVDGRIAFSMKAAKSLAIRVPDGVDCNTLAVQVKGAQREPNITDGYVRLGALEAGVQGAVTFDVPCKVETETVDGIPYTTTWVGNQLIAINPRGTVSPLPF